MPTIRVPGALPRHVELICYTARGGHAGTQQISNQDAIDSSHVAQGTGFEYQICVAGEYDFVPPLAAMIVYRVKIQDEQMQMNVQEEGTLSGRCVALISPTAILAFAYASLTSFAHAGSRSVIPWNFFPVPSTDTYPWRLMP